jgi:hypothetical protein
MSMRSPIEIPLKITPASPKTGAIKERPNALKLLFDLSFG